MAPSSRFAASLKPSVAYLALNFSAALEEADDLAVLGVRGHPVPGLRREVRRAGLDDRMEPLGHGAIRSLHLGDLLEHGALPVRLARFGLQLLGRAPSSQLVPRRVNPLDVPPLRGALGGPRRALLCSLLLSHCEAPPCAERIPSSVLQQPEDVAIGVGDGGHQAAATDIVRGLLHRGTRGGHLGQLRLDVRHMPVGHR